MSTVTFTSTARGITEVMLDGNPIGTVHRETEDSGYTAYGLDGKCINGYNRKYEAVRCLLERAQGGQNASS